MVVGGPESRGVRRDDADDIGWELGSVCAHAICKEMKLLLLPFAAVLCLALDPASF